MSPSSAPRSSKSLPQPRRDTRTTSLWWYYVVFVATVGTFAWVPFMHAAIRLRTVKARLLALTFGGIDALIFVLVGLMPPHSSGTPASTPARAAGLLMIGAMMAGCVVAATLRRPAADNVPTDSGADLTTTDPAVKAALAARARRDEARTLAERDPLLARDLHIGRPDLARIYHDGGLVDVNSAPVEVIAGVCGISIDVATIIVSARVKRGEPFANIDELLVLTDLPLSTWDLIRDRAVLLL